MITAAAQPFAPPARTVGDRRRRRRRDHDVGRRAGRSASGTARRRRSRESGLTRCSGPGKPGLPQVAQDFPADRGVARAGADQRDGTRPNSLSRRYVDIGDRAPHSTPDERILQERGRCRFTKIIRTAARETPRSALRYIKGNNCDRCLAFTVRSPASGAAPPRCAAGSDLCRLPDPPPDGAAIPARNNRPSHGCHRGVTRPRLSTCALIGPDGPPPSPARRKRERLRAG